jgi:hypothetical protein
MQDWTENVYNPFALSMMTICGLLSVAILITLLAAIVIMSPRYLCWYFGSS